MAAIEITAAPLSKTTRAGLGNIPKLEDDALKLATVRGMTRVRTYGDTFPVPNDDGTEYFPRALTTYLDTPRKDGTEPGAQRRER